MFARTTMVNSIALLFLIATPATVHGQATPQSFPSIWGEAKFSGPAACCGKPLKSVPNGDVMSAVFEDANIDMQGSDQLSSIVAINVVVPLNSGKTKGTMSVSGDFRGFINKPKGARIKLIYIFGDKLEIVRYGSSQTVEKNILKTVRTSVANTANALRYSLIVVADRDVSSIPVMVNLDSVDLANRSGSKKTAQK